jgi:hypothetical protein
MGGERASATRSQGNQRAPGLTRSQGPSTQRSSSHDPYLRLRGDVRGARHGGSVDTTRTELAAWVQGALDETTPGQFLLLEYLAEADLPVEPYAQAAIDPGGWHCEVVSAHHLPAHRWPLDESALQRSGWSAPSDRTANWWRTDVGLDRAASLLVDALWVARACTDPDRYAISIGTFPTGPDDGRPRARPDGLPLAA